MNGGMSAGISKGKKATMSALSGPMKTAIVPASAAAGGAIDIEPGLPRVRQILSSQHSTLHSILITMTCVKEAGPSWEPHCVPLKLSS